MSESLLAQFKREFANPIEEFRQVPDINSRDAIPMNRRWEGMIVYVISTKVSYELAEGILNTDWREIGGAISSIEQNGGETIFTRPDNTTVVIDVTSNALIIDGFLVSKGPGNLDTTSIEVGDRYSGWDGDRFLAGRVIALPYSVAGNTLFAVNNEIFI